MKIQESAPLVVSLSNDQIDTAFSALIKDGRSYVNLLQIYNPSSMHAAMIDFEALPEYISDI